MDEFCLENPLYLLAEERSCDCLMSEFKRLNIIFPLDEGAGVFSGDFAYSNNPESLKSIECSGVDNRFISVLVIKNASFLEPQEVAVKISNTVNSRYHTYHFNVKTGQYYSGANVM